MVCPVRDWLSDHLSDPDVIGSLIGITLVALWLGYAIWLIIMGGTSITE